jgi:HPt (histidine-containing phosphotransfer) domain-containing protein
MNDHVAKPIDPTVLSDALGRYYRPSLERGPSAPPSGDASPGDAPTLTPPARTSVVDDTALPSVEGLNTAEGLLRVAGNRSLYLKLLRQFVEQQASTPSRIAEALSVGDRAAAERVAHTVKGVAGNLGAGSVQTTASALEEAIAGRGDTGTIEALRQRLADELGALIGRLRPALCQDTVRAATLPAASPPVDPEALRRSWRSCASSCVSSIPPRPMPWRTIARYCVPSCAEMTLQNSSGTSRAMPWPKPTRCSSARRRPTASGEQIHE